MADIRYHRVLLKLSGESLGGEENSIDTKRLQEYATQIREVAAMGVETALVIGGGNIFRGLQGSLQGFDRVSGDQMGMLATVINALAMQCALESLGQKTKVLTAIRMEPIGEAYSARKAIAYLQDKYVIILAGGTGNPFFTTDTAAALRGIEIKANVLLKGTRVDGIYTADPEKEPSALRYEEITFDECYRKNLKVMDLTSFALCRENNLPVVVFNMEKRGNLKKVICGEKTGTLVKI